MKSNARTGGGPQTASVRERIAESIGRLTPSEKRAANLLLANYPALGLESITRFAERAETSVATLQRFAIKLGFKSYPDFRSQLQGELIAAHEGPLTTARWSETTAAGDTPVQALRDSLLHAVAVSFEGIQEAEAAAVVKLLADLKRRVYLAGGAFTHPLAVHLHFHLRKLRPGTVLLDQDLPRKSDALLDLRKQDTLIVFDVRRYQPEMALTARIASDSGAHVVLITDQWMSDIAKVADHVFRCKIDASSPWDTLIGPLAVVETLAALLDAALWPAARPRLEQLDELRGQAFLPDRSRRLDG